MTPALPSHKAALSLSILTGILALPGRSRYSRVLCPSFKSRARLHSFLDQLLGCREISFFIKNIILQRISDLRCDRSAHIPAATRAIRFRLEHDFQVLDHPSKSETPFWQISLRFRRHRNSHRWPYAALPAQGMGGSAHSPPDSLRRNQKNKKDSRLACWSKVY